MEPSSGHQRQSQSHRSVDESATADQMTWEERGTNIDLLAGRWYSTEELAGLLNVDPSSVRRWRTARPPQGPPFVRLSERLTIYSAADVEGWLRSRRVDPGVRAA